MLETSLSALLPWFDDARRGERPLALATLLATTGSTYRKCGAQMLFGPDGDHAGLLSGGCLEGDLGSHAAAVISDGKARLVSYNMRSADDELWGLGSGCEGAMHIALQRMGPQEDWQPFAAVAELLRSGARALTTLQFDGTHSQPLTPPRRWIWSLPPSATTPRLIEHSAAVDEHESVPEMVSRQAQQLCRNGFTAPLVSHEAHITTITLPYAPPPALLLLGAGADAPPVVQLAHFLGWRSTVFDHRPALLEAQRFPPDTRLECGAASQLDRVLDPAQFDATVIMSHHLAADRSYLQTLAARPSQFIGLLGPAPRREKLLSALEPAQIAALGSQLHAPVGLDLGGRSPQAIALSIIAAIQAQLHARHGAPLRGAEA